MENKKVKEISFEYRISPNYSVFNINGIHGGLNGAGEIIANFFVERAPIPKKVKHQVNDDGSLGKEISREGIESIIRYVMLGVSMNPNEARSIGEWLISKADQYELLLKKKEETKNESKQQSYKRNPRFKTKISK